MNKKPLVFVVDDDETIRYSLERYLTKLGWDVKAIANGFEVLMLCLYLKPDLILSDIRMPKLDGISLLQGLKNNPATAQVPVIFMSAYASDEIMEQARNLGAQFFLIKPFANDYLYQVIRRALPHLLEFDPSQEETENA